MNIWIDRLYGLSRAIWITVSGWIVTLRAQRRMKKSLGRKATDLELASLKTWMRVKEAEQREEDQAHSSQMNRHTHFWHLIH